MAGLARGGAGGPAPTQISSRAVSFRGDDVLAGERARRNVKNNDPSLIEPILA